MFSGYKMALMMHFFFLIESRMQMIQCKLLYLVSSAVEKCDSSTLEGDSLLYLSTERIKDCLIVVIYALKIIVTWVIV